MGKYLRKAKASGEVAVMEVSQQCALGVRTRARSLAAASAAAAQDSSLAYLELRSRRLEKPLPPSPACKDTAKPNPRPDPRHDPGLRSHKSTHSPSANSGSVGSVSSRRCLAAAEVSFGENFPEADARDRYDRETTPCSLIRNPEELHTPSSTNRPTNSSAINRRTQTVRQSIPTAHEMEEFFSGAEQLQQRIFIERYNFDPVDDHPLPGRYEWVKIDF